MDTEMIFVVFIFFVFFILFIIWAVIKDRKVQSGTDGYIGDSSTDPVISKDSDDFTGTTTYKINTGKGFIHIEPTIYQYEGSRDISFNLMFMVHQFSGLDSVIVKLDDETKTFYANTTSRVAMNTSSTYGALNSYAYTSYTSHDTLSAEFFIVNLKREDIPFLSKLAKCKTARMRFMGNMDMKDVDIGQYERKSLIKMLNLLNEFVKKGYRFYR